MSSTSLILLTSMMYVYWSLLLLAYCWQLPTILLDVIQSNQNCMWVKLNESLYLLPTCHSDVNKFQMYFSYSFVQLAYDCLRTQCPTALERKAFLHWVMLFIKLYRNPVACLSGQSISRSSIMISTTPVCFYLLMFRNGLCFCKSGESGLKNSSF